MITTQRENPRTDNENRELRELALRGLQLLSAWNSQVMELVREVLLLLFMLVAPKTKDCFGDISKKIINQ